VNAPPFPDVDVDVEAELKRLRKFDPTSEADSEDEDATKPSVEM